MTIDICFIYDIEYDLIFNNEDYMNCSLPEGRVGLPEGRVGQPEGRVTIYI